MPTERLLAAEPSTHRLIVDPATDRMWRRVVESRASDVFHAPDWIAALRDTYDFDFRAAILADRDSWPIAGIAYAEIRDMLDPRIVSLPFSDYCDPLVDSVEDWSALVDEMLAAGHRMAIRCLHNDIPLGDERFDAVETLGWHCVDLRDGPDVIWERLAPAARRAIRKARSEGVEVRVAEDASDLRAFFELHLRVRKLKYQLLAQPFRFFENLWRRFIETGKGWLLLAEAEDSVVGGVMFLRWKDAIYYKFNASDPAALCLRPNDVVLWNGIGRACEEGAQLLDFGVSDWDQEGLLRYKRKYATEEKTVHFLRHQPAGLPTERDRHARALLPQLTNLFVAPSVPHDVTERAGDLLYRYFT